MKNKGITLISLVITIIILIILASVGIYLSLGNNGIFNRAKQAKEETNKQEATDIINLKITTAQMNKYAEKQEMPTLQELADALYVDNEIQYVALESKAADKEKVTVGEKTSIFTKLKQYPYEFEINSKLQLASINGIKLDTSNNETHSKIYIENYQVALHSLKGGAGSFNIDKLENYNTITIESRTCTTSAGANYWRIIGYYEDDEGQIKTEYILNTRSQSNVKETFDISKYNKIQFSIACTSTIGSGEYWYYYNINNIEIF